MARSQRLIVFRQGSKIFDRHQEEETSPYTFTSRLTYQIEVSREKNPEAAGYLSLDSVERPV